MTINPSLFSSDRMDWETPPEFFKKLDQEFHFDMDVCATDKNAKCPAYYTLADNSLKQIWSGVCWMNPPYGREIIEWMCKAYRSSVENGATVVCLVPARTDTAWWHDYAMKGEIRFIRGRLKFVGAPSSAPFPSAVVIFRPKALLGQHSII